MRFGLMNMFPDATIGAGGSQNIQMSQLPTDKKPEDATKQTTVTKSVFSTLDADQNNKVNYSEANSIFANAQKSLENGTAQKTLDNAVTDPDAKVLIKKSVLSKFNATEKFSGIISKFSVELGKQSVSASNEQDAKTKASELTAKLDSVVQMEAQTLINSANAQLDKMYNDAMMSAITDYNNGKNLEVNKDQKDNTESLKGTGDGKAGDIKTKTNAGEAKFESKVFSKFDSTPDGSVKASQGEINIASLQDIVGNKLSALGSDSKLSSAIQNDLKTAYEDAKNAYSIDIGSKDVKAKSAEELENKANEAIAKLDKKVQSKKVGADKKLEKAMNKAYDDAYKTNLANASKLGDTPVEEQKAPDGGNENSNVENKENPKSESTIPKLSEGAFDKDNGLTVTLFKGSNLQVGTAGLSDGTQMVTSKKVNGEENDPSFIPTDARLSNGSVTSLTVGEEGSKVTLTRGTDGQYTAEGADVKTTTDSQGNTTFTITSTDDNKTVTTTVKLTPEGIATESSQVKFIQAPIDQKEVTGLSDLPAPNGNSGARDSSKLSLNQQIACSVLDTMDNMLGRLAGKSDSDITTSAQSNNSRLNKGLYNTCVSGGLSPKLATFVATPSNNATPIVDDKNKIVAVQVQGNNGQNITIKTEELEKYIKNKEQRK